MSDEKIEANENESKAKQSVPALNTFDFQKSDAELVIEGRQILDALVAKVEVMRARGLEVLMGIDNGYESGKAAVQGYIVKKELEKFLMAQQPAGQVPPGPPRR